MNIEHAAQAELRPEPEGVYGALRSSRELRMQVLRDAPGEKKQWVYETPEDVVAYWKSQIETKYWYSADRDFVVLVFLDEVRRILGFNLLPFNRLDGTLLHPRDVFKAALDAKAHSLVLVQNRCCGGPEPAASCMARAKDLLSAGEILEIRIVDTIIFEGNKVFIEHAGNLIAL